MVKVVIGREIPEHWLSLHIPIIPKEKIVSLLSLSVEEGIVVVSFEALHHVPRMACPLIDFPVRFHCVDEMRTAILNGYGVPMVMVPRHRMRNRYDFRGEAQNLHVCEQVYGISVIVD